MSEFINNSSKRKTALKEIIRKLHQGKTVESLQQEFGEIIQYATAGEIAEAEREMIAEGTPVQDIQQLCDLHVAVFREGLENEPSPESMPGHPVYDFRMENEVITRLMETLADLVSGIRQGEQKALSLLRKTLPNLQLLEKHYDKKENLFFPYLENHGFEGPASVMWGVDNDIRSMLKNFLNLSLATPAVARELNEQFQKLNTAVMDMIYKEEKILIPEALNRLTKREWEIISAEQERVYKATNADRAIETTQADEINKEEETVTEEVLSVDGLPLSTGALTIDQINLMLTHLPIDITFVDENDEVCFFSQTKERIFTRTAAIIGRKVQKCHPPQSVHVVQKILDDFRSGKRDVAEFWIEMAGKFILIRYYALREIDGAYKGTIEVTQDVTSIRSLHGERRLLDD